MEEANRLYLVVSKFAEIDLHPQVVDNITMGLVFEDLIRRFNEAANETAGDHFTPREVIRPAAPAAWRVFGQDYNPRSYAVSASDLLIKGFSEAARSS